MTGWRKEETALWVRRSILAVQAKALDALVADGVQPPALPRDGFYSDAWNGLFKAAVAASSREGEPSAVAVVVGVLSRWDQQGPRDLLVALEGIDVRDARNIELAWAWWTKLRGRAPAAALAAIRTTNEALVADRSAPLDAKAAEGFVGDKPRITASSIGWSVLAVLVLGAVGFVGFRQGKSRCEPGTGILDTGRRLVSRAKGR